MDYWSYQQAEAYERRLRRILKQACPMLSCQRRDGGVEFTRFIELGHSTLLCGFYRKSYLLQCILMGR